MNGKLILNNIKTNQNKIVYDFEVSDDLKKYFNSEEEYFIEYDVNVESIPESILAIPFVCNILPCSWLLDFEIVVNKLDKNFYDCIPEIKSGYAAMYPDFEFKGNLVANKIESIEYKTNKAISLFSGGVDATSTLIKHMNEKPILVNLQGSDIGLQYNDVLESVKEKLLDNAKVFNLPMMFIKTTFRRILNEKLLNEIVKRTNDNYWHAFQHGIAIISHTAPIAFLEKASIVYIASSYTKGDNAKCASDPTIDNNLKMGSTTVYHDNFELTRGDKIKLIGEFCKNENCSLNLRVCFNDRKKRNCCKCEKCYRTIFEIIACGYDPVNFGFDIKPNFSKIAHFHFKYKIIFSNSVIVLWEKIQNQFKNIDNKSEYEWFLSYDFNKSRNVIKVAYANFCSIVKKMLKI